MDFNSTNGATMPPKVDLDANQCPSFHCPKCMASVFQGAIQFLEVSRLVTGRPTDEMFPVQVWICMSCGSICFKHQLVRMTPNEREQMMTMKAQHLQQPTN